MPRAIWKGPFVDAFLLKPERLAAAAQRLKIWSRRSTVLPEFVGKVFSIHNGQKFINIKVADDMVGHKFGEFAKTRKAPVHKKKDGKK